MYRKELHGNLLENAEEALLFLEKHLQLRWKITKDSVRRKEILELPKVALREAMVNAVCLRDYFEQGAQLKEKGRLERTMFGSDF